MIAAYLAIRKYSDSSGRCNGGLPTEMGAPMGVNLRRPADAVSAEAERAQPGEIEGIPPVENMAGLVISPWIFVKSSS